MHHVDGHAHRNAWRHRHPAEKVALGSGLLLLALLQPPWPWAPLLVVVNSVIAVALARVPARQWVLLLGTVPLLLREGGAGSAIEVVLRTTAASAALLLLAVTTPMTDLAWLARRLGVPASVTDLSQGIYRQAHLAVECRRRVRTAQAVRCGGELAATSFGAEARAAPLVLAQLLQRSLRAEHGLATRAYAGSLTVVPVFQPLSLPAFAASLTPLLLPLALVVARILP